MPGIKGGVLKFDGEANVDGLFRQASKTHDFANIATDGANDTTTVTVSGAALGDFAIPSLDVTGGVPAGALLVASVTAANTVTVTLQNETGGALNLGSGTLRVLVIRK